VDQLYDQRAEMPCYEFDSVDFFCNQPGRNLPSSTVLAYFDSGLSQSELADRLDRIVADMAATLAKTAPLALTPMGRMDVAEMLARWRQAFDRAQRISAQVTGALRRMLADTAAVNSVALPHLQGGSCGEHGERGRARTALPDFPDAAAPCSSRLFDPGRKCTAGIGEIGCLESDKTGSTAETSPSRRNRMSSPTGWIPAFSQQESASHTRSGFP
jgi:hypothetical protein